MRGSICERVLWTLPNHEKTQCKSLESRPYSQMPEFSGSDAHFLAFHLSPHWTLACVCRSISIRKYVVCNKSFRSSGAREEVRCYLMVYNSLAFCWDSLTGTAACTWIFMEIQVSMSDWNVMLILWCSGDNIQVTKLSLNSRHRGVQKWFNNLILLKTWKVCFQAVTYLSFSPLSS